MSPTITPAQVAGWVGIWVALVAFYVATAILTGEVWNHVSPLLLAPYMSFHGFWLIQRSSSSLLCNAVLHSVLSARRWRCALSGRAASTLPEVYKYVLQEYLPLGHMRKATTTAAAKTGRQTNAQAAPAQPTIAENKCVLSCSHLPALS